MNKTKKWFDQLPGNCYYRKLCSIHAMRVIRWSENWPSSRYLMQRHGTCILDTPHKHNTSLQRTSGRHTYSVSRIQSELRAHFYVDSNIRFIAAAKKDPKAM